jgi:uncharacterized protein (DUF2147 family)
MTRTFYLAAALLMASTAAHAGSSNSIAFEVNGHRIRIEAPKNCDQLSCIQISGNGISGSGINFKNLASKITGNNDDDDTADNAPAPAPRPAPVAQPTTAPVAASPATPPAPMASSAPAPVIDNVAPASVPAQVASVAPAPQPMPAPVAATTPVGVWATEDNKGNVRIEPCGQNLCGFAEKTNERILINMKPSDNKWVGRIHDPDGGSTYDSTIAMKGPNALKVQGCAMGGLFCGGQTWKRVS